MPGRAPAVIELSLAPERGKNARTLEVIERNRGPEGGKSA